MNLRRAEILGQWMFHNLIFFTLVLDFGSAHQNRTWLMRLLIAAEGVLMSLMPEGITLVLVELGIRLFDPCIAFLLQWPGPWSMMVREASLLTPWFGLLEVDLSVGGCW